MRSYEREFIRYVFHNDCFEWMDYRNAEKILKKIGMDIYDDIKATAEDEEFSAEDVRISTRRVLMKRLGLEE